MLKKLLLPAFFATSAFAAPLPPADNQKLAHDILRDLVAVRSVHPIGTRATAKILSDYFLKAGFPAADVVTAADPKFPHQANVVVRLHGKTKGKPVMWLSHMDVVDARAEDWTLPPFQLTEKDGYFYGRGTTDMKDGDAGVAAALIRMKQEGYTPNRDIIAAFTADEEVGLEQDGPAWLLKNRHDLVDAGVVINNDGASGEIADGKRLDYGIETSQKVYLTWHLDVTNKGGHSSEPRPDNAIYQLSDGLSKLQHFSFPLRLNETTRAYFQQMAQFETGARKADMLATAKGDMAAAQRLTADISFNALLHTTCVATMLAAGVQENALPSSAQATVQCRVLPGESADSVRTAIAGAIADPAIKITMLGKFFPSPPSPLSPAVLGPVETVVHAMWPGVPVIPAMAAGASDSIFTRAAGIPSYGISGEWDDIHDVRAHGRDERRKIDDFYSSVEFTYRLMKALSQ
ncbi:MAG: Acetylornithine deacetylase [Alphaproteobacteria bacterium]|nr:Acetylornithine deacetylase [Alphaproteobacteria bacterium]